MTRPISPPALDALSRLAADPLARVHPATRAGDGWFWLRKTRTRRVTSAGHALLEGHEG